MAKTPISKHDKRIDLTISEPSLFNEIGVIATNHVYKLFGLSDFNGDTSLISKDDSFGRNLPFSSLDRLLTSN